MHRSRSTTTPPLSASMRYLLSLCLVAAIGLLAVGRAHGMGFATANLGPCAERGCVVATGEIGALSAEGFAAFLKDVKVQPGALVLLDSDGGDVISALKLGGIIRRAGLATAVAAYDVDSGALKPATCASACAYVFLGGVTRSVVRGGRVGVHQLFTQAGRLDAADAQWLASLIGVYVNKMGGSFGIMTLAMSTPSSSMRWVSAPELVSLGMITNGPADSATPVRQTIALAGRTKAFAPRDLDTGAKAELIALTPEGAEAVKVYR